MADKGNVLRYGEAEFTERIEADRFGPKTQALFDHLDGRVIGQPRAHKRIARSFSMYYAGLKPPNEPIGSFIFAGPTGWGKTFEAEELGRFLVADEPKAPILRIPCGKYSERHRVSELFGSPPGYVDSDKLPILAQLKIDQAHFWVKAKPYLEKAFAGAKGRDPDEIVAELYESLRPYLSIVLFDEVEKAHSDLWSALLHIIGDGELALSHGDVTSFANSVIILTCNVGGKEQQHMLSGKSQRIGFGSGGRSIDDMSDDEAEELDKLIYEQTLKLMEDKFPPELLGRLKDNIIVFRTLKREQCRPVLENMLRDVQGQLDGKSSGIPLVLLYTEEFKDFLLEKGINRMYGLRPLKGKVKKYVRLRLANAIESGALQAGDEVLFRLENGRPALYRKPRPLLPPRRQLPAPPKPSEPKKGPGNGT